MIREYDYLFKIVIIGNSSVGKSSVLRRFADDQFQQSYLATIGVDFRFKHLNISGNQIKLQIWDTAGQERFRTITSAYYKGAHGIVIVYDLTCESTFKDISDFWLGQVEKYGEENVILTIAGNKSDAPEQFDKSSVEQFCKEKNIDLYSMSAKTGQNIDEVFNSLAEKLIKIHPKSEKKQAAQSDVISKVMKKKNEFKLQSGAISEKKQEKKKCC